MKTSSEYIIAIACGDGGVDYKKASKVLNTDVTLAKPEEAGVVLNIELGTVTPIISVVRKPRTMLDPVILENEYILCGRESLNKLFRVKIRDLLEYLKSDILDVLE